MSKKPTFIKKNSSRAWLIWALAAGFFFAEYFARVSPSVMVPELMRDFRVGAFSLGSLSAFFYYAYVGMQLPVGTLVDRYGPRKLLSMMSIVCGLSSLLFAYSSSLSLASFARFFMGFSAAFAFVGALKLASVWFKPSRFGFLSGTTQALGMLGAAFGEGPVSLLVSEMGWRRSMYLIGAVLIILGVLIGLIVRDNPSAEAEHEVIKLKSYSMIEGLGEVLKNPQTWVNGIFVGFLFAPTASFAELWGTTYLHNVQHFSTPIASFGISMIFIGWGTGSPLMGWISDSIQRRKPVMIFSAFFSCVFLSAVLYTPNLSVSITFTLLFLYGMSNVGVATSYAVACESNPRSIAGTSMSFANMASVIVGALFQPIIGKLLDYNWTGQMQNGAHLYSAYSYKMAMIALPACFVISLLAAIFLKESYGKHITND